MRRRTFWTVLACFGIGAVVNVAVAWAIAWMPKDFRDAQDVETPLSWPVRPPAGWPEPTDAAWIAFPGSDLRHAEARGGPGSEGACTHVMTETRTGWPVRSMRRVVLATQTGGPATSEVRRPGAIELPPGWRGRSSGFLPGRPLVAGFVANTAVYAGVAWLAVAGVVGARRKGRRGRGLCAGCGYPQEGLASAGVCPECGEVG